MKQAKTARPTNDVLVLKKMARPKQHDPASPHQHRPKHLRAFAKTTIKKQNSKQSSLSSNDHSFVCPIIMLFIPLRLLRPMSPLYDPSYSPSYVPSYAPRPFLCRGGSRISPDRGHQPLSLRQERIIWQEFF